ncbi:uncharacterized protein LOC126609311 [Malus sylvestris]|uniref:uncharacterized protein LOC126609311 n=1 Tax=Malus sylvestris TaxID=3752 RepID=UPI0021ACF139|nr:uncharacterized protein LOC126609311 [Malus sylvestris]
MGDRIRRSMSMQMVQYQARIDIEDAELFNAEVELVNSFMQSEHHGESSHHGSVIGSSYMQRNREGCHDQMMKDYFIECPRFPAHDFWRQFWMRRKLFESILNAVANHDHYFAMRIDATESTVIENLKRFCKGIEGIYGATYLRNPNREDLKRFLRKADKKRFPDMIRSLDCMH